MTDAPATLDRQDTLYVAKLRQFVAASLNSTGAVRQRFQRAVRYWGEASAGGTVSP